MDRREFLKRAGQITLGSLLPCPWLLPGCLEPDVRPNILLILTDDQHAWSMPDLTQTNTWLSPGLTFNNAFVTTPICAPSRASIMTGKRVGTEDAGHGVKENREATRKFIRKGYQRDSLGYWLKTEAGYKTALRGKWLNGYGQLASWQAPGYDSWICTLGERNPVVWNRNGTVRKTSYARRNESAVLAESTVEFIESASEDPETPWFCFTSLNAPHSPYDPSNLHENDYDGVPFPERPNFDHHDPNKPPSVRNEPAFTNGEKADIRDVWRGKMSELQDVDDAVNTILSSVDLENTYVFFSSDNGFQFGEHRCRSKGHPYEESVRVPLLVRGPGMRENATSDLLAANMDIAPTILELAGLDPFSKGCDGRSLVAPMFEEDVTDWRDALLLEYYTDLSLDIGHWQAVRTEDACYIERQSGFKEYYDMASDPYQLSNIHDSVDAVTLHQMSTRLSEMRSACGETLRAAESPTTV